MTNFHLFTDSKGTLSTKFTRSGDSKTRSVSGINYLPQVASDEAIYSATVSQMDSAINHVLSAFYDNVLDKIYSLAGGNWQATDMTFKTEVSAT